MSQNIIKQFKIAIIDNVGKKAGMDYYDGALMKALSSKIADTYIFSNFIGINHEKIKYYPYFDGFSNSNKLIELIRFARATFKSSYKAKIMNVNLVITHIFSAEFVFLFLVLIPRLFKLKIAVILHDVSSFRENDKKIFQNLIYNKLSKYLIVHNQYSYDELLKLSIVRNNEKIRIIKHGGYLDFLDKEGITKKEIKILIGLDNSKKYILFFGQLKKVKGLDLLLNAMNHLDNDIDLIIAGKFNPNDFSHYDKIINNNRLSKRVTILNRYINHLELLKLFKSSDMMILPYKKIYQSGVLLMAMSYGLPVLATDLDPFKEIIIKDNNGLLFKKNDRDDLILKIEKNINDESKLKQIAENALNTIASDYSWDNIANQYINLIK